MNRVGCYGSMNFRISDRAHMRRHGRPASGSFAFACPCRPSSAWVREYSMEGRCWSCRADNAVNRC